MNTHLTPTSLQRGMSLLELLVGIGILSLTLGVCIPAAAGLFNSLALSSLSSDFASHVQLTRSEAIKRNARVVMCKAQAGTCAQTGGWEQGWIVFHDTNRNAAADDGEEVIARHEALPAGLRLIGNQTVAKYIAYTSEGTSKLVGGGFQAGTLTLCQRSAGPAAAKQIILNSMGRPRVQAQTLDHCA